MSGIFVIDGHDIELFQDVEAAAQEIEGYDVHEFEFIAVDGTVYVGTVDGPEWGPVSLVPTTANRLADLMKVLIAEAGARGVTLPPGSISTPEAVWDAVLASDLATGSHRRAGRRWFRKP